MIRALAILVMLSVVTGALFLIRPQIDLDAAALFYRDGGFYLAHHPLVQFLYHYSPLFAVLTGTAALLLWMLSLVLKRDLFGVSKRVWAYLLLALLLGPGLIVNLLLKEHWGRARPIQIEQFGGDKQFTPPLVIAHQCNHNCSFPSGHASAGFYFIAPALLARRRRWLWLTLAVLFGFLVGWGRMAQGGHFLSDVIFSFLFVAISSLFLYWLIFGRKGAVK